MQPEEAEKIINTYGDAIASAPKDDRVIDIFSLPYSPARVRYAYFVYTEALIKERTFTEEIKQSLEVTYALLDTKFIEGDVDRLNRALKIYAKNEKARAYIDKNGGLTIGLPSTERMVEYHNFVADCYGNWKKK